MSLESAIASRNSLAAQIGKNALNIKYPKEFELYVIALELTDENFRTKKYFVFPVNPSSVEEIKPKLTNVQKTLAGVTVLKTPTFVPTDITLSGSFGRNFKVLLGSTYEDFVHSFQEDKYFSLDPDPITVTDSKTIGNGVKKFFDDRVKTGYGCIKILEEIVDASTALDSKGRPMRLILHNPALGNSYLVTAGTLRLWQNEQTNMIWNYSLPLKSIAPLESLYTRKDLEDISKQLNTTAFTQRKVNELVNNISKIVAKGVEALP